MDRIAKAWRLPLAFAVAPLAPILLASPVILLADRAAFVSMVHAYPAMLLLGIPVFAFFLRQRWLREWPVMVGGAVVGALVPALMMVAMALSGPSDSPLLPLIAAAAGLSAIGAIFGAASGFAFWWIGLRGNTVVAGTAHTAR
jgi:hypothetical protein